MVLYRNEQSKAYTFVILGSELDHVGFVFDPQDPEEFEETLQNLMDFLNFALIDIANEDASAERKAFFTVNPSTGTIAARFIEINDEDNDLNDNEDNDSKEHVRKTALQSSFGEVVRDKINFAEELLRYIRNAGIPQEINDYDFIFEDMDHVIAFAKSFSESELMGVGSSLEKAGEYLHLTLTVDSLSQVSEYPLSAKASEFGAKPLPKGRMYENAEVFNLKNPIIDLRSI